MYHRRHPTISCRSHPPSTSYPYTKLPFIPMRRLWHVFLRPHRTLPSAAESSVAPKRKLCQQAAIVLVCLRTIHYFPKRAGCHAELWSRYDDLFFFFSEDIRLLASALDIFVEIVLLARGIRCALYALSIYSAHQEQCAHTHKMRCCRFYQDKRAARMFIAMQAHERSAAVYAACSREYKGYVCHGIAVYTGACTLIRKYIGKLKVKWKGKLKWCCCCCCAMLFVGGRRNKEGGVYVHSIWLRMRWLVWVAFDIVPTSASQCSIACLVIVPAMLPAAAASSAIAAKCVENKFNVLRFAGRRP